MKKKKLFIAAFLIAASLTISACSFGSTGSGEISIPPISQIEDVNKEIYEIYKLYQAQGGELTYEQWLLSIKGDKGDKGDTGSQGPAGQNGTDGKDGHSPVVVIGSDGYWYIDGVNTGVKAQGPQGPAGQNGTNGTNGQDGRDGVDGQDGIDGTNGQDGLTPYIGSNGHWWIGDTDTGVAAQGPAGQNGQNGTNGTNGTNGQDGRDGVDGKDGINGQDGLTPYIGTNGNWWIGNTDTGVAAQGPAGQNGTDGKNGVSVTSTYIDENGDLIVAFSDGTTSNAGHIKDNTIHTVSFYIDGDLVLTKQVDHCQKISRPSKEELASREISNWYYLEGENYKIWEFFGYVVTENMNLYSFTNTYIHSDGTITHTFNRKIIDDRYLNEHAYCNHSATYYYSCECGAKGNDTFVAGEPLHHYISQSDYKCCHCDKRLSEIVKSNYGYDYLKKVLNSSMASLYEKMDMDCSELFSSDNDLTDNTIATYNYKSFGLTLEESLTVVSVFFKDNPLYYWLSHSVAVVGNDSISLLIEDEYLLGSIRKQYNNQLLECIEELCDTVFYEKADYYTSILLHDYIVDRIEYKYDENGNPSEEVEAHNIIGVISKRGGVCEAYARAYQLFLNFFGIENIYVTGESKNVGHAWNLVKLDGHWYWYDLTYDETNLWIDGNGDYYFDYEYYWSAQSDDGFVDTHIISEESKDFGINYQYELPDRSENDYLFNHEGYIGQEFIIDDITYVVIGANQVEIKYIDKSGNVEIPERFIFNQTEYECISIGNRHGEIVFCSSVSNTITSLKLPKTIVYIWEGAITGAAISERIGGESIENYYVDNQNPYFKSVDGVLFTKDGSTLVAYPTGNEREEYSIPESCVATAVYAFYAKTNLNKLYVHKDFLAFGLVYGWYIGNVPTWDYPFNNDTIVADSEIKSTIESLKEGGKVIVDGDNPCFHSDDYAFYKLTWHFFDENHQSLVFGDESTYNPGAIIAYVYDSNERSFTIKKGIYHNEKFYSVYNIVCSSYISSTQYPITNLFDKVDAVIIEDNDYFVYKDGILYVQNLLYNYGDFDDMCPVAIIHEERVVHILDGAKNTNTLLRNNVVEEAYLPRSVASIALAEFSDCQNLRTITLTNAVKSIGFYAFAACHSLSIINFEGTIEEWGTIDIDANAFYDVNQTITVNCSNGTLYIKNSE